MERAGPALLLLWLTLSAGPARAFVRSHVDGNSSLYLYWPQRTIAVFLHENGTEDVSPGATRSAVLRSLTTWSANDCTDLLLQWGGTTATRTTNLMSAAEPDNINTLIWREQGDWPEDVGPETLALTTLVYDLVLGSILDGDIDFNGSAFYWTVSEDANEAGTDVQNTVTHELGHLIGLDHSEDADATMFGHTEPGDLEKRDLAADDLEALCYIYPAESGTPEDTIVASEPAPLQLEGSSCTAAGGTAPSPALPVVLVLALGLLALVRRRRAGRD